MSVGTPLALLLIPLVALALWALAAARRRRGSAGLPFPDVGVLERAAVPPRARRRIPTALLVLAVLALALGVARPELQRDVPRERATIMLAVDVSGSMSADDVAPYRLRAAQDAALRFADRVPRTYQVGLVAFSGGAAVVVPPTTDRMRLRRGVESLLAGGATAIGDAIVTSLTAIQESQGGVAQGDAARILLLSDGANTQGVSVAEAVDRAQAAEVPVFTVALGTQDGRLADGRPVPPDVETLAAIAEQTGGQAYESRDSESVGEVYERLGSFIGTERRPEEVTAWAVGAGLLLLAAAGAAWWRWGVRLS
ncbi:MAG TPA: VWA domain-containing protein [Miltoncostaeaceae bacterium]|nr:VWA domain-containing protein [Miltoncostaeaceae bacterium]